MVGLIPRNLWLLVLLLPALGCEKEIGPDHYYKIGLDWMKNEEPSQAIGSFTTAIEMDGKYAKAYEMRGINQQRMEKYAEARTDYNMAIQIDPKLASAYAARANLNLLEDLPEQAVIDANAAIELDDKLGKAYLNRGQAQLELGHYDLAIEDMHAANRLIQQGSGEDNAQTNAILGQIYFIQKDYDEAIYNYSLAVDFYNEHIRRYPKHEVTVTSQEGKVWAGKAAYDAASKIFSGRAAAYLAINQIIEAHEDAKKAVRLDEDSSEALFQRARTLVRIKRFFEAKKDLNAAIELDEDRADLYNLRAWISATCPIDVDRNGLAAVQDALRACELSDYKNADYLESLAAAYAETKVFDKALQWQNEAMILAGEDNATARLARFHLYQSKMPYRMAAN